LPSLLAVVFFFFAGLFLFAMTSFSFTRNLMKKYPGLFSLGFFTDQGVPREVAENIKFQFTMFGSGWNDKMAEPADQHKEPPTVKKVMKFSGMNPGYGACAMFLVQSAMVILKEREKLPQGGGVFTTAAAFSKTTLMERINQNGIDLEIIEQE